MVRFVRALVPLVLVLLLAVPVAGAGPGAVGRYIVVLRDNADSAAVASEHAARHGALVSHVYRAAIRGHAATIPEARLAALRNDPRVVGVAPGVPIYSVRVLNSAGSGTFASVACGIDWVTGRRAEFNDGAADGDPGINIAVANMSLGGSGSDGAGSADEGHTIASPGVCILSTWKGGGYNTISGTSMASPHAAGTAALCIATGECTGAPSSVMSKLRLDAAAQPSSYGFSGDPNSPNGSRYYGYLVYAGGY